jgi:ribosomal protein L11 methyltransferase
MIQLSLLVPEQLVEAVSDALIDELDAMSVSVEDADADSDAERALFGEPGLPPPRPGWARSTLSALFTNETQATEAATLLLSQDWTGDVQVRALEPVPDEDWVRVTQSQFAPVEITPSFWIVPSWHMPPAGARTVIRLDPGLAFGTGSHPTTRMCLRWIAHHAAAWPRVLDYGCGSGILAIAAALHGAREVDAVDIDPAAVASACANAQANGVVLHAAGTPDIAGGPYDVVLANILAKPLELLAPVLARLATAGVLVLAGILERQADELRAAYAPWCMLEIADAEDGWVLMTGQVHAARSAKGAA